MPKKYHPFCRKQMEMKINGKDIFHRSLTPVVNAQISSCKSSVPIFITNLVKCELCEEWIQFIHSFIQQKKNASPFFHAFFPLFLPFSHLIPNNKLLQLLTPVPIFLSPLRQTRLRHRRRRRRLVHGEVGVPVRAERDGGGLSGGVQHIENRRHLLQKASACRSPLASHRIRLRQVVLSPLPGRSLRPLR